MDQETALGIFRAILTSAGGALVTNGVFTSTQWQDIVGVAVIIAGAAWIAYNKRQHKVAVAVAAATGVDPDKTVIPPSTLMPAPRKIP